ncbi:MAG: DoxX family membrane protein [Prolixibacteraceae bacterium]|jgi:thiosulfate dehydrogenase [quinone] large subunit|nr:DoxX family membrane protein [Prolixibacteraceae bacterium]
MIKVENYSRFQLFTLVAVRILIGWYCLYEGVVKIMNPNWSSFAFLNDSQGWFAPIFKQLASNSVLLSVVDFMNVWGLVAIGFGLILGVLTRIATVSGIVLIGLYCLSHPTLIEANYMLPSSETAMWIGKNVIFVFLLLVLLAFPTGKIVGVDRLLFKKKN